MANNFTATQAISSTGLCATLVSTDTSDYLTNIEGVTAADVVIKTWIFRDASGTIIKTESGNGNKYSASCAISLLTFNVSVYLSIYINNGAVNTTFNVQNNLIIPCLGI